MVSLMLIKILQVFLIIYGAFTPGFYDDNKEDGFAFFRYVSLILPQLQSIVLPYNRASFIPLFGHLYTL
jgi:hypothetical protein